MSSNFLNRDRLAGNVKDLGGRGFHAGLSTLGDFKKFILRGNVVDLAVGVVIGAAFNIVIQSFVKDIIQPLIGIIPGMHGFGQLNRGPFLFGDLLSAIITFLITAAVVYFFVVKPINTLEDRYNNLRPKHQEAPTTRECPFCLSTVNLKATRCAYCTAQLPPAESVQSQVAPQ